MSRTLALSRLLIGQNRHDHRYPAGRHRLRHGRWSAYLDARDLWIGMFRGADALFICPLPTLVVRLDRAAAAGTLTDQLRDWVTGRRIRVEVATRDPRLRLSLWAGRRLPGRVSYGAFIDQCAWATTRPPLDAVAVPDVLLGELLRVVTDRYEHQDRDDCRVGRRV